MHLTPTASFLCSVAVGERRRVALNILAGAPTFIKPSCQTPSVHPLLTPVFSAAMAAVKSWALWLFDGESWPGAGCAAVKAELVPGLWQLG